MSKKFHVARSRGVRVLLISGAACIALPAVASASAVNLATASPFAVLGGSAVTNTGPSVLDGDLGVAPGTSLTGFGLPAVVNGATHDNDAVAAQGQSDLTTAYNTAASQPVAPADVLTGRDLGGLTLTPGAYSFASSAQMTGTLTLNAEGNPEAQFVFEVGSALTTASASSVVLINGASPCNVYWQIGSSATLGSTTAFQGNLLALTSISLNTGATVRGRALARNGAVTLDDNTINNSMCTTPTSPAAPTSTSTSPSASGVSSTSPTTGAAGGKPATSAAGGKPATAQPGATHKRRGSARLRLSPPKAGQLCNSGFTASVSGREIKRVLFTNNRKVLATRGRSPFRVHVPADFAGRGLIQAHVTFKDATHARTLSVRYPACAAAVVQPGPAPSTFTG